MPGRFSLLAACIALAFSAACERGLGPRALPNMGEPRFLASSPRAGNPDYWLATCRLRVTHVSGSSVSVEIDGLPGNRMQAYANYVALWQSAIVPWGQEPIAKQPIEVSGESGSVEIGGVDITRAAYTVAYGVGPSATSICATELIPRSSGDRQFSAPPDYLTTPEHVSLMLERVTPNSIDVSYTTFTGYLPASYDNWLGLWRGRYSPYNSAPPLAKVAVSQNLSDGQLHLQHLKLDATAGYTLVYFVGAGSTEAAAILYFDAAQVMSGAAASARESIALQAAERAVLQSSEAFPTSPSIASEW